MPVLARVRPSVVGSILMMFLPNPHVASLVMVGLITVVTLTATPLPGRASLIGTSGMELPKTNDP